MSEYVLTLLAAAAVTYILTPLVRRFAIAVGAMHAARERDVHELPTPLLGGFAIYGGLVAALLLASRLSRLSSVFAETNMEKGLLLAGGLVVIMGFVDDRWGMGALSKLAGQVAAGVILVWSGAEIPWIPAPGGVTLLLTSDQQIAVTILVVVVTMNAVNFIDGLDGLAAGIVAIGAVAFFAYYYTLTQRLGLVDQTAPALVSILLAGVCIGFLPHNFYPARIFMGDTGSLLIGLLLAYAPISSLALLDPASLTDTEAYAAGTVNRYGAFIPLLVPAAILLIPYADLLMAVVRRTRAGKSVFAPDKKHLQHRLLAIGHSHRTSVLIMYLWAALFSGSVIWLSIVRTPLFVLAVVTVAAIVALLLVTMPRLRPWSRVTAANRTAHMARRAAPAPVPAEAAGERARVTAPPERAAWQPDGRTALGGNGAPSSAPGSGAAGDGATGNRTAAAGAGGNEASRSDPADRAGTGSDGTGNRAMPGRAGQATGAPRARAPGGGAPGGGAPRAGSPGSGATSGPGIPAAAISGGVQPADPPEQRITRASTRGAAPWEAYRRGHPPWDTHPGFPAQEPARALPPPSSPWEAARGAPPWETARGDPRRDTVRNDEPPTGSGSDPGAPPWLSEPPPLP
jgi:UDP-GlcNAc:undecaprenyl-phosphate/decaprenyl-phosphate GlcNAc-1-phosphate transferase